MLKIRCHCGIFKTLYSRVLASFASHHHLPHSMDKRQLVTLSLSFSIILHGFWSCALSWVAIICDGFLYHLTNSLITPRACASSKAIIMSSSWAQNCHISRCRHACKQLVSARSQLNSGKKMPSVCFKSRDTVHECHNSAFLLPTIATPIDSASSLHNASHCAFCSCTQLSGQIYELVKIVKMF